MNEKPIIVKTVGYARVSTDEQAKGHSVDNQLYFLKKWSEENDWKYIRSYKDPGFSGGTDKRPSLQEMMKDAKKHKFNAVIFTATDRLSRDRAFTFSFMEKMFKLNISIGFISLASYGLITNLEDPFVDFMLGNLANIDQFFRKQTKWKTKKGLERVKEQGRYIGKPPSFFTIHKKDGKLHLKDNRLLEIWKQADIMTVSQKRPYNLYSKIAKKLKIEYFQVYRAIKNRKKLEAILEIEKINNLQS